MKISFLPGKVLRIILLLIIYLPVFAQEQGENEEPDTTRFINRIRQIGARETRASIEKYNSGRILMQQQKVLLQIRQAAETAKLLLRGTADSLKYQKSLDRIRQYVAIIDDGIFVNKGSAQTSRNLTVSALVLDELLIHSLEDRQALNEQVSQLVDVQNTIDSLSADSTLYTFPLDSVHTVQYLQRVIVVSKELAPIDTLLRKSILTLQGVQNKLDLQVFELRAKAEDIERMRTVQIAGSLDREFPYIWESAKFTRPLNEIMRVSVAKEKLALTFYLRDYYGRLCVLVILIILSWMFLKSLKKKWLTENTLTADFKGQLVIRYPLLSAITIVISIFQFLFLKPPFVFSFFLWLSTAITLAIIMKGYVTNFWHRFWLVVVLFFILAWGDNMILQASRSERWWILFLSIAGLVFGIYIGRSDQRKSLKERGLLYFIIFLVIMEAASIILNVMGSYNLGKTFMVTGFSGLLTAILFLWTVRLINEGLSLVSKVYRHPERKLFYINFDRIGERVPGIFYVFLVFGWFVITSRNFYALEKAISPIKLFLNSPRTVGSYTFTIGSLFIFVIILGVSAILSQILSFFSDPGDTRSRDSKQKKVGLGSWLLLVRIFVLTLGIFFAFAAAGIPLDRLTIIIGALGVGIGLGLQGLVTNLVSGLIIAFEKPVNVGDMIEVNGKPGIMKSIGFRSSIVTLTEGAFLIIPNGDLLSQHLVNWSMGNSRRRLSVVVNILYGNDIQKTKQIIETILNESPDVIKYPHPVVAPKTFQMNFMEIEVLFWVNNSLNFAAIRGEIILKIEESLLQEKISISAVQHVPPPPPPK